MSILKGLIGDAFLCPTNANKVVLVLKLGHFDVITEGVHRCCLVSLSDYLHYMDIETLAVVTSICVWGHESYVGNTTVPDRMKCWNISSPAIHHRHMYGCTFDGWCSTPWLLGDKKKQFLLYHYACAICNRLWTVT